MCTVSFELDALQNADKTLLSRNERHRCNRGKGHRSLGKDDIVLFFFDFSQCWSGSYCIIGRNSMLEELGFSLVDWVDYWGNCFLRANLLAKWPVNIDTEWLELLREQCVACRTCPLTVVREQVFELWSIVGKRVKLGCAN